MDCRRRSGKGGASYLCLLYTSSEGKTVIMIAHRLSTVAGVDQIYVIEDGQITESGKSRELLEKGGVFSHMWQDYQTSVQWKVAKEVQ